MSQKQVLSLSIQGMSCASCVGRVERGLSELPGVADVRINLAAESAQLSIARPEQAAEVIATLEELGYPARASSVTLNVQSLACASCAGRLGQRLQALPGVIDANVNLAAEIATVTFAEGAVTPQDLANASTAAGFPASLADAATTQTRSRHKEREAQDLSRQAAVAAIPSCA